MNYLGYSEGTSFLHRANATAKLLAFLITSAALMTTYDTRLLVLGAVIALYFLKTSQVRWEQISLVVKLVTMLASINLILVRAFAPAYGEELYHSRTVSLGAQDGHWVLTSQQLFYEFNIFLKYFTTIPLGLLFLLTTNPSYIASSLNRVGVSYRVAYAFALTLRYIPDIQEEFVSISQSQQARGYEMGKKASLGQKVKGAVRIVTPLILSSIERIETVSNAMMLRRFGRNKKRTWYSEKPFARGDYFLVVGSLVLLCLSLAAFVSNGGRFFNPFI